MLMLLALVNVDPETQRKVADGFLTNPWLWVCFSLTVVAGTLLWMAVYHVRVTVPAADARDAAKVAAAAERTEKELAARAAEKAADRELFKSLVSMAQDSARQSVSEAHKEIGERVEDVRDVVTASHDTGKTTQRMIVAIGAKLGVTLSVLAVLGFASSATSPAVEVTSMPDMSAPPVVLAEARPAQPQPDPDVCNPRCPAPQVCSGRICTMLAKPKPPKKPKPIRKVASTPLQSQPPVPGDTDPPGPQSHNYAILSTSWTDGRDPFDIEPEIWP